MQEYRFSQNHIFPYNNRIYLFKRQPKKMIKHIQPICHLLADKLLSVFDHFVGLALKGLDSVLIRENTGQSEPVFSNILYSKYE